MAKHKWVILALIGVSMALGCEQGTHSYIGKTNRQSGSSAPSSAPANPSLQAAYDNMSRATLRVIQVLDGVKDDASAQSAAGPLRSSAAELSAALKQMKVTVAALDTAGQKQEIAQFYQKLAEKEKEPPLFRFQPAVERVVASPQGPKLRSEINAILDAIVGNTTGKERENIQRWIQEKNLRQ